MLRPGVSRHITETDIEEGIECSYNASLISRVVYNLLQNAYKYGRNDGYVRLSLRKEDGSAVLRVKDNGQGIAEEVYLYKARRVKEASSSSGSLHVSEHGTLILTRVKDYEEEKYKISDDHIDIIDRISAAS